MKIIIFNESTGERWELARSFVFDSYKAYYEPIDKGNGEKWCDDVADSDLIDWLEGNMDWCDFESHLHKLEPIKIEHSSFPYGYECKLVD